MSYVSNVPVIGQSLGASRPIINQNFTTIKTTFDVDHKTFTDANAGKHRFVHYVDASSDIPSTSASELALFNKVIGGANRLFLRQISSGTQVQLSGIDPLAATTGYSFLPGGILIQWGVQNSPGSSGTINYGTPFVAVYSVILTPRNDGSHSAFTYYLDGAPGNSDFSYRGSTSGSDSLFWIAIGTKN